MKTTSKKTSKLFLGFLLSFSFLTACSDQWREVDTGATLEEINQSIDEMAAQAPVSAFKQSSVSVNDLLEDPTNTIYFKRSAPGGAYPETVLSFADIRPFFPEVTGPEHVFSLGIQEATVIFVDGFAATTNQRHFALMIKIIVPNSDPKYFTAISEAGDYRFDDKEGSFEVLLTGKNGDSLTLKTFNLSPDYKNELGPTPKFVVYRNEVDGSVTRIGQFAALAGFGG